MGISEIGEILIPLEMAHLRLQSAGILDYDVIFRL